MLINIVAKPKMGKRVSACTFPKPLLLLDFDRGFESVKNTTNKDGSLVVPDWKDITVVELFKRQASPLVFKSWQLVKGGGVGPPPDHAKEALPVLTLYNELMAELATDGCHTISGVKIGPFKTIVIHPLTAMFRLWKDGILFTNSIPELRRGDYLTLEGVLANQFIPNLKSLMDTIPHVVCVDHEDFDQSDTGTLTGEYPVGPTKNLGKNLSEFFDEVWRMEIAQDGCYCWRTRNHGLFKGAGSRHHLPDPICPATFAELSKYLK
jgi:hypothetical protein